MFAVATFALVSLVILFASEVALQLREFRRQQALQEEWADRDEIFEMHPFLQVVPRPNERRAARINAFGFRGEPIAVDRSSNPEALRIFALGGSTSFSAPVVYSRTYPAQLARRLEGALGGRTIEMQNAACDWYSTEHSLIRYQFAVRPFRPDVVLVFHAINDLYRSFGPEWFAIDGYRYDYSHYYGPLIRARRRSELSRVWLPFRESLVLRALRGGGPTLRGEDGLLDPAVANPFDERAKAKLREGLVAVAIDDYPSLQNFRANLEMLVHAARLDGVTLVLATQPSMFHERVPPEDREGMHFALSFASENGSYPDFASMVAAMRRFNETTREVAARMEVPLVDLERRVPPELAYFSDDVHMTPDGLALVAAAFEERLVELLATKPASPGGGS